MLDNFFELNKPYREFKNQNELVNHFAISTDLRDVKYTPDSWPITLKKNKTHTFCNVSLSKTEFNSITFTRCVFEDCLFIGSSFYNVEFHGCTFKNCNFYKASFRECYINPDSFQFDSSYRSTASNVMTSLFQNLLDNSNDLNQADFAAKADVMFRRWKRSQLAHDMKEGKISRHKRYIEWAKSMSYDVFAGFGYMPLRFLVWTVVIFFSISTINYIIIGNQIISGTEGDGKISFADSLFYTFSVLTILGFSSVMPQTTFAKLITVFQALAGIGWLSVLTSIIVKRVLR